MAVMRRALLLAALVLAALPAAAGATTLVNDPAHPFSASELTQMQRWVDVAGGRVRTVPGEIVMSKQGCPGGAEAGCAGCRVVAIQDADRFSLMHELGHEDQMYDGPGSPAVAPGDCGSGHGWSADKVGAVAALLHTPAVPFWTNVGLDVNGHAALSELAADAYAQAAIHPRWSQWWGHGHGARWTDTSTPYGFRAGPVRYRAIRSVLHAQA
jgi:hypothetical protein